MIFLGVQYYSKDSAPEGSHASRITPLVLDSRTGLGSPGLGTNNVPQSLGYTALMVGLLHMIVIEEVGR